MRRFGWHDARFMMDQIKAELAPYGVDKIPGGWQFVHIDVPVVADTKSVASVPAQAGTYIGTAPGGTARYEAVDDNVSAALSSKGLLGELGDLGVGRPQARRRAPRGGRRPDAGGRARPHAVEGPQRSTTRSVGLDAHEQRGSGDEGCRGGDQHPRGLRLERSAARARRLIDGGRRGGIDGARRLPHPHRDPRGQRRHIGVFMAAPDVFDELPADKRSGVRANGLAMLGEIVANQTRAANDHDAEVLRALGVQSDPTAIPFARVFPIGRTVGVDGTPLGDGTMKGVYRGLGRGLAALMMSDAATHDFIAYDLTNVTPTVQRRDVFGWAEDAPSLQWGSFASRA